MREAAERLPYSRGVFIIIKYIHSNIVERLKSFCSIYEMQRSKQHALHRSKTRRYTTRKESDVVVYEKPANDALACTTQHKVHGNARTNRFSFLFPFFCRRRCVDSVLPPSTIVHNKIAQRLYYRHRKVCGLFCNTTTESSREQRNGETQINLCRNRYKCNPERFLIAATTKNGITFFVR